MDSSGGIQGEITQNRKDPADSDTVGLGLCDHACMNNVTSFSERFIPKSYKTGVGLILLFISLCCFSKDELVLSAHYPDGEVVPYMLTTNTQHPKIGFILMPGKDGQMNLRVDSSGTLKFDYGANFPVASRELFAKDDAVVVSTDSSGSTERVTAILEDLERRYGKIPIYILGISKGTLATIRLAKNLDDRAAGYIHTSSMSQIDWLDSRELKSRQLIVHHINDGCKNTPYYSAKRSAENHGTDLLTVEGGVDGGTPCGSGSFHVYNGVEEQTVNQIRAWALGGKK